MGKLYEYEVVYHVLGVKLTRTVYAHDEMQAWIKVKDTITTEQYWLEDVLLLGEAPKLCLVV